MGRVGRPSKSGKRRRNGKRICAAPFDHGSDQVQRRRGRFARFQGGKAGQQVYDPIGRAWAVGLLENARIDPAVLRDAGREYAIRYWAFYPGAAEVSNYRNEVRCGRLGELDDDPNGERFLKLDAWLKHAGRACYDSVQSLCLDFYWFPDDDPAWLGRLIEARLAGAAGQGDAPGDAAKMQAALEGLLALAEGRKARKRGKAGVYTSAPTRKRCLSYSAARG